MTKTALENLKIESNERIAKADREQREKERQTKREIAGEQAMVSGLTGALRPFKLSLNDERWYFALSEGTSNAIANIPTWLNPGQPLRIPLTYGGTTSIQNYLPSVYTAVFVPTYGYSKVVTMASEDDINYSFSRMKSDLRANNSRIGQYDPGDLGQVQFATLELACGIETVKRVLAIAAKYVKDNAWFADSFIRATGFDPADTQDNWKSYKKSINLLIDKFNDNVTLIDCGLVQRRLMLNSVVFADAHNFAGQFLVPVQHVFGRYNELAAIINYIPSPTLYAGANVKLSTFIAYLKACLNELIYSAVLTDMYADIRGALESPKNKSYFMVTIEHFVDNGEVHYSVDSKFGDQIRNAIPMIVNNSVSLGSYSELRLSSLNVNQNTAGFLYQGTTASQIFTGGSTNTVYRCTIEKDGTASTIASFLTAPEDKIQFFGLGLYSKTDQYLNLCEENKTPGGIVEASRFRPTYAHAFGQNVADTSLYIALTHVENCGSEVILEIRCQNVPVGSSGTVGQTHVLAGPEYFGSNFADEVHFSEAFGYKPNYTICLSRSSFSLSATTWATFVPSPNLSIFIADWHYPVALNYNDVLSIHSMCTQSLLVYGSTPKAFFSGLVEKVYKKRTKKEESANK